MVRDSQGRVTVRAVRVDAPPRIVANDMRRDGRNVSQNDNISVVLGSYTLGTQHRLSGDISFARGRFYRGDRTDLAYRGRAELTARLSVEPGVSVNWVDLPTGRFTATLLSTRSTLSFSPRMLAAVFLQYNSTSHLVATNVRFRWEYRPGSDLFVVYSDGRDTLERGFPALINRGLTIKLTRLFRL
jgi:hypothetical protein